MGRNVNVVFFIVSLFLVLAVFFSYPNKGSNDSNVISGFAFHPLYTGYALPYAYSASNVNTILAFSSVNANVSRSFDVSDSIVYRRAFVSYDGQQWTPFILTTTNNISGDWIYTKATASVSFTPAQLRMSLSRNFSNNTYVVIYSCSRINNAWDCHDGWQIIKFDAKINIQTTTPPNSSTALNTFYISTNGIDTTSRNGSFTAPWKSLYYACSQVKASGSIIHVNSGTYAETKTCNLVPGVSIEGEGDTSSIILSTVSDAPTIYLYSSSITNGNQHVSGIKLDGKSLTARSPLVVDKRSNVEIHDCTFVDFSYSGISFYGEDLGDDVAPNTFVMNNKFYNNKVINCASYNPIGSPGNLQIHAQQGMRIYGNTIVQTARGAGGDGFGLKCVPGLNKDLKIYNNTITMDVDDDNYWSFAMEFWNSLGGIEIYDNRVQGPIDLAGHFGRKGVYDYTFSVHDNILGHDYLKSTSRDGLYLESTNNLSDIIIYNNLFKNLRSPIILWTTPTSKFDNIGIYYNIFYNIGMNTPGSWGYGFHEGGDSGYTLNNLKFYNNIFIPANVPNMVGIAAIQIPSKGKVTKIEIKNNIMANFGWAAVCTSDVGTGSITGVSIEDNIFYNDDSTLKWVKIVPTAVTQNNIIANPMFVDAINGDFHLKYGSPAINNGTYVGLNKDYAGKTVGNPPDIGAFEYS